MGVGEWAIQEATRTLFTPAQRVEVAVTLPSQLQAAIRRHGTRYIREVRVIYCVMKAFHEIYGAEALVELRKSGWYIARLEEAAIKRTWRAMQ